MIGWFGIDVFHWHVPDFSSQLAGLFLHDNAVWQLMGQGAEADIGFALVKGDMLVD
jgi:hypothetical protein